MRLEDHLHKPWLQMLALPAWLLYRPIVWLRNALYDRGWLRVRRLPVPVICVGNVSVGGTGKTPVVQWLVDYCRAHGARPAVIARGYGAGADGVNDEAAMLAAPVFCDADRYRAGQAALKAGHDLLIMDDGFQHRRLHRDLNVVCLDASRPTGHPAARQARTLPLGLFREGYAALRRADWAVLTRWDQATPHDQRRMEALLQHYQVPYGACLHRLQSAQALTAQDGTAATADVVVRALTDFTEPVLALAAIAVPAAFQQSLIDAGVEVAELLAFPDHYHFQPADIERIVTLAAGRPILCTAKDAVKLQHVWPQDAAAQIWQVPVQLAWEGDAEQRFGAQVARLLPSP